MTLLESVTKVTNWLLAREAGDRISREIRAVRHEYIGKEAYELMPDGKRVKCVIVDIDYQDSLVGSKWTVLVIYSSGLLKGQSSWTSDCVLEFTDKK